MTTTEPRVRRVQVLVWALILVATAAGVAFLIDRYQPGFGAVAAAAARIPALRWLSIGAGVAVFYVTDWVRFGSLFRLFGHRLTLRRGFELTCISYFVSSLTPAMELHLPAMIYVMAGRESVPVATATAVTVCKSLFTVLWICALAALGLALVPTVKLPDVAWAFLPLSIAWLAGIVIGIVLVAIFSDRVHAWAERVLAREGVAHWKRKLASALDHSASALAIIGRSRSGWHLACHLGGVALVISYVFVGRELCLGVGLEMPWPRAFAVFSASLMIAYLAPVPGSVGVAEGLTAYLIDPALGPQSVAVGILVRTLCWHAVIPPGVVLLAFELRKLGWDRWRSLVWARKR